MDLTPQELNPNNKNPEGTLPAPAPAVPASSPAPVSAPAPIPAPVPTPTPIPETPKTEGASAHVDLGKILLPKKEVPGQTALSAERASAGELFKQEEAAAKEGTDAQLTPAEKLAKAKDVTEAAPALKELMEEQAVKPLETYQHDIESVVQDKNISVLSIASAEAERRSKNGTGAEAGDAATGRSNLLRNIALVASGFLLLVGGSGALAYLVTRPTSVPIVNNTTANTPFISVDGIKTITITPDEDRDSIIAKLNAARQATSLSLGLMSQLNVTVSSSTTNGDIQVPLDAPGLFAILAPHAPESLVRSLQQTYLLGVHVYDGNQSFIIAKTYSYEETYAAMLNWETYMQHDLSFLFAYTPTAHIPEENISTTTPQTSSPVAASTFVDKIVENHDARAIVNSYGDISLLWTFLDRNTLVITTNDATLREIIRRLNEAPVTPIPGQ